ncbi:MAG: hypothetical protein A3E02_01105 [Candidatus Zambryskibacteria bacterium RIFCSPHIGHO2_12_FULL_38_34]|nr:MAG: hypothetical protein A3E02_01105 [Candidatus Zambryskibacteria bacterium RIFCSPHIGHO2_12_FULL_38_34]OHB07576.1 MAG: hypothetical protein A3I19_00370 [Candidatus Zambryskibacteria bacterium RIFCSPLOWO2_02_FULL_38_13]
MAHDLVSNSPGLAGVAIFSKIPMQKIRKQYYAGSENTIPHIKKSITDLNTIHTMINSLVLSCEVAIHGSVYTFATTHGTWTPKGVSADYQLRDFYKMISILDGLGDFVLAGDFNAPRMYKSFQLLATKYKDNIPAQYTTSIDINIHRHGKKETNANELLTMMVDGLFTTPKYNALNVQLVNGVSDHMAVVADISVNG